MYRARFGIVRNKTVRRRPNSVNCHPDSGCRQLHAQARLFPSPAVIGEQYVAVALACNNEILVSCCSTNSLKIALACVFLPVLFQDDTNEVIKITYAGLTASSSYNSVTDYLSGSRNRGDKDIYSIGSIAYQLLSGGREPPTSVDSFCEDDDGRDLEEESSRHHRQNLFLSHIWRSIPVSRAAKNFIESGMQHGFVTVEQALQHRWITQTSIYMQGTSTSSMEGEEGLKKAVDLQDCLGSSSIPPVNDALSDQQAVPTASLLIASNNKDITEAHECDPTAEETSFTEEESVGAPEAPKELALPVLVEVSPLISTNDRDTAGAHDGSDPAGVDGSSSSDDEPVGVPLAPEEPAEAVLADNLPAPTGAESPKTPTQRQKTSAVAAHQAEATPESPSQTPPDFADLRDVFHQVSDDDGEVTIEKLRIGLRSKYTEEEVNAWFKSGKFDDSRNVKYKEFLAEAIQSRRKIERLRVQEAFQKIDKGKQGFVTVGNLRAVLGTDNSEYIEQMIKAANTKRDNKITYEKFKEVLERSNRTEI